MGKGGSSENNHYLGITEDEAKAAKKDKTEPWMLKKFDDCRVKSLSAGLKNSFVFTEAPKEVA